MNIIDEEDRVALDNIINILSDRGKLARRSKQIREIVPIEKWVDSEYYMGPDVRNIFNYWKEALIQVYSSSVPVNEVIVSGSIGTGKSTFALYLMLRKIYEMSCFENIPGHFNLMSSSVVSILYFSLSKYQAELTGFGQMKNLLDSIPYFQDNFRRNSSINSIITWPSENLIFNYGSDISHSIGMNLIGSILDEANFYSSDAQDPSKPNKSINEKMARMYSSVMNRAKSRFVVNGIDQSLSVLVSSSTTANSFTEKRIQEAYGKESTKIFTPTLWDVRPKGTYSDAKFWVYCGDDSVEPFIVRSNVDLLTLAEYRGCKIESTTDIDVGVRSFPLSIRENFVQIPNDFRDSFEVNLIQSIQDIAGVSVSPLGRLFTSKGAYSSCIDNTLRHPFVKECITVSTGDSCQVKDFLIPGFQFKDLGKPHYIHIDQSVTTDHTGIAMVHVDSLKVEVGVRKPIIVVDFMLAVIPPRPPRQISIAKVRDFIFYLRDKMDINIASVTYDSFQSMESRQILSEGGINSQYLSVDKTDDQYLALSNVIMEGNLRFYDYSVFKEELFGLVWYRSSRKVDHLGDTKHGGSKDVSDAVAGAVWGALQSPYSRVSLHEDLDILFGANSKEEDESVANLLSLF